MMAVSRGAGNRWTDAPVADMLRSHSASTKNLDMGAVMSLSLDNWSGEQPSCSRTDANHSNIHISEVRLRTLSFPAVTVS